MVGRLADPVLIGTSAVVLTGGAPSAIEYRRALGASAMRVYRAGQLVHGLD